MRLQFVFVGEHRSRTAIRLGVTWRDGRLSAKTLAQALLRLGLSYDREYVVVNAYHDPEPWIFYRWEDHRMEDLEALEFCKLALQEGTTIISLGSISIAALQRHRIPHRCMIHPAARGAIRARAAYYAHVQQVLGLEEA